MESLNKPWNIPSIQVLLGENATIKTNQKQGNVKAQVQLDISCAEVGSFFNMHSKWRLISRLIPILFQNTKGNLAFKLPSSPKWWFSPFTLIPWEHQHTFNYSFTPDDYSAPLCKLSQEITYCTALCLYTSHSSWRAEAAPLRLSLLPSLCPLRDSPSPDSGEIPVKNPDRSWQRFLAALPWTCHGHSHWDFHKNPWLCMGEVWLGSQPGLFYLLKNSCIYQDNRCFYVEGTWRCF